MKTVSLIFLLLATSATAQISTSSPQIPYIVLTLPNTCAPGSLLALKAGNGISATFTLYLCNGDGLTFSNVAGPVISLPLAITDVSGLQSALTAAQANAIAAIPAFGTTAGTAAQGNDGRLVGAEQSVNKGAAGGYPALDSNKKVPSFQLPLPVARPDQLTRFRVALAKTKDGVSDTKVLFLGDSTTEGIGGTLNGTFVNSGSYPTRINLPKFVNGLAVYNVGDGRWSLTTGWTVANGYAFCNGGNNAGAVVGSSGAGALTFTPGAAAGTFDAFDVYFLSYPGNGSFTATATGGSTVTTSTNNAAGPGKVTVMAAAAGSGNAVVINAPGAQVFITAIEPWLSTSKNVRKGNIGVSGATTTQCADSSDGIHSLASISLYAPDLTVISLGINDAGFSTPPSTVSANLQALITAAKTTGDVILVTMPPSQDSTRATSESLYQTVYANLAISNNLPLVDVYNRFGATYNPSLMNADGIHPNNLGYWDMAAALQSLLGPFI